MSSLTPIATLHGTIAIGGGGGGGEDVLNTLFNAPAGQTPTPFEMSDDNENHTCYGFLNGLNITLPETVKTIAPSAFKNVSAGAIKGVSGAGVETIGNEAFRFAANGTLSVSFPALKTMGNYAFSSSGLQAANFPLCESIGTQALSNSAITSVNMPLLDTVPANTFDGCYNLATVTLTACETVGVEAFKNCNSLASISLPSAVTIGKEAFFIGSGNNVLTSIDIPVCTTLGDGVLKSFAGTSIRLPAVTSMGREQFLYAENLTDLYLGYNGVVTVTREEEYFNWDMFSWMSGPKTINVHVPAGQLANYQADSTWTEIVTASERDGITVTFVGDYE